MSSPCCLLKTAVGNLIENPNKSYKASIAYNYPWTAWCSVCTKPRWIPARGFGAEQKDVLDYSCRNSTFSLGITIFPLYNHASGFCCFQKFISISHFSSFFFSLTLPSHSDVTGGLQKQGTAWAAEPWGGGCWWPHESFPQHPCSKGLIHKGQPQGQPLDLLCHPGRGRRWRNQQLNGWRHKDGSIPPLPSWSTWEQPVPGGQRTGKTWSSRAFYPNQALFCFLSSFCKLSCLQHDKDLCD